MPNALPRSLASVNVVVSSASTAGASSAPNTPWTARAVTSMPKLTAAPPTAEATAKPVEPDEQGPLAAEEVGQPAADQQQAAEGEGVAR